MGLLHEHQRADAMKSVDFNPEYLGGWKNVQLKVMKPDAWGFASTMSLEDRMTKVYELVYRSSRT